MAVVRGKDTPALLYYSRHDNTPSQPSIRHVIAAKLKEEGSCSLWVSVYTVALCWKLCGTPLCVCEAANSVSSVISEDDGHVSLLPGSLQKIKISWQVESGTFPSGTNGHILDADHLLTQWSRVLLEKLTGFAANQEIPRILWNPQNSLPYSQAPATCPYPEPTPSSTHNPFPLPEHPS